MNNLIQIKNYSAAQSLLNQKLYDEGVLIDGKNILPVSLTPYLISKEKYLYLYNLCKNLTSALEKFLRLYIKDKTIQGMYPELSRYRALTLNNPLYEKWIHLARFDLVETQDGEFKLFETNCDCPGAILFTPIINKIITDLNLFPKLENNIAYHQPIVDRQLFINSLVNVYKDFNKTKTPNIAFLTSTFRTISSDMNLLERIGMNMGITCKHTHVQNLSIIKNKVCFSDTPIDMVYQKFDAYIDDDNQAKPCIYERSISEVQAYWSAIEEKSIMVFNSFPSALIAENKRTLAYLLEPEIRAYFTADENNAIDKLIPKTYSFHDGNKKMHSILAKEFIKNKSKYVIKRVIDTRGRGVWIGKDCDSIKWSELVNKTYDQPFIVQEYIAHDLSKVHDASIDSVPRDMYSNLAMFVIAGNPSGLLSRASPEIITNVGQSGCIRPVYVV